MDKYYPIMLDIKDKVCKIIGGGRVAERKIAKLLEYGAVVEVISPMVSDKIMKYYEQGKVGLSKREYVYGDLENSYLVYAATDNEQVNKVCLKECKERGILLNVVDRPEMCNFIVPANINRGHLNISVSTNGKSPMLSRKIREDMEKLFAKEYGEYIDILGELRDKIKKEVSDINRRREIFHELVYSNIFNKYLIGEIKDLKKELYNIYFNKYSLEGVDINGKKGNNNRE